MAMNAFGVRHDLAIGERADVRAHLLEHFIEGPGDATAQFDRGAASGLDLGGRDRFADRGARGGIVARLRQPERWRDRLEPMALNVRNRQNGIWTTPAGNAMKLRTAGRSLVTSTIQSP